MITRFVSSIRPSCLHSLVGTCSQWRLSRNFCKVSRIRGCQCCIWPSTTSTALVRRCWNNHSIFATTFKSLDGPCPPRSALAVASLPSVISLDGTSRPGATHFRRHRRKMTTSCAATDGNATNGAQGRFPSCPPTPVITPCLSISVSSFGTINDGRNGNSAIPTHSFLLRPLPCNSVPRRYTVLGAGSTDNTGVSRTSN